MQVRSLGKDVFISKLNSTGSILLFSTYLGGNDDEYVNGIAVDNKGNAYVTGYTNSFDFPATSGAYNEHKNGSSDIFLTKLDLKGSNLLYSTFFGGDASESAYGMTMANYGEIYITGYTGSRGFPITKGVYDSAHNGLSDAFVTKFKFEELPTNIVSEKNKNVAIPKDYQMFQNYPNPFNPVTTIKFQIPISSYVTIKIYNIVGQHVKTLVSEQLSAGSYKVQWDGIDERGNMVSSGIYIYRLTTTGGFVEARKMVLIRHPRRRGACATND